VIDVAMPVLNGLEATRQILRHRPDTKIIILSAHNDDAYVKQAIECGASGYLLKQIAANLLPRAIREVHRGTPCFSPEIYRRLVHHRDRARAEGDPHPKLGAPVLSSREMEVLQLIAEGHTNKDMSNLMGISIKTVEKHRHNLMEKLNIHEIAGLTRYAIETGIIECSVQRTTEE
jgi:DNA-binding NarL/FixJ family response regulator